MIVGVVEMRICAKQTIIVNIYKVVSLLLFSLKNTLDRPETNNFFSVTLFYIYCSVSTFFSLYVYWRKIKIWGILFNG